MLMAHHRGQREQLLAHSCEGSAPDRPLVNSVPFVLLLCFLLIWASESCLFVREGSRSSLFVLSMPKVVCMYTINRCITGGDIT